MAVTPNYSWPTPDDSDAVSQGAAAMRSLGTAVDATVFANAAAAVGTAEFPLGTATPTDGQSLIFDAGTGFWVPGEAAAGAQGGGDDKVFWENDQTVTTSYSITSGQNAMTAGPITIGTAATVTVPAGSEWTVV